MRAQNNKLSAIIRDVGGIQFLIGPILLVPGLVSILYGETYSAISFGISSLITTLFGFYAYRRDAQSDDYGQNLAMVTAASAWIITSVFGSLPFYIAAHITPAEVANSYVPAGETYSSSLFVFRNYMHALFESVSGFTTTGLTMSVHEPSIGKGLLFYRSLSQWIGGAGMVVLSLAILQRSGRIHGPVVYQAEARRQKIRPGITQTAQAIWKVYLVVTGFSFVYLFTGTYLVFPDYDFLQNLFESVNHAFTAQSTGGFSTFDNSISGYNSDVMEMIYVLPMLLGAISIPLYYAMYDKRSLKELWYDNQGRWLILISATGSVVLTLVLTGSLTVSDSVREGVFQFVSALSTTGWQTADLNAWPDAATLLLAAVPMIIGGSAGATVGGIKIFRSYLIAKGFEWRLKQVIQPSRSVPALNLGKERYTYKEIADDLMEAYTFSAMYLAVLLTGIFITLIFMGDDYRLIDGIFESVSAQGTVGLSTGITNPTMNPVIEVTYMFQMLLGRLELIPVIIMIRSLFKALKINP